MDVSVSDSARDYLAAHGGVAYVRPRSFRCCSGGLTSLDIDVNPPIDADRFSQTRAKDVDVRFLLSPVGAPNELTIETRGRKRPHLVAFWDGCAFKA